MGVFYKGIELEGLDKKVGFYHSNALRAMGQDSNQNADYLEKICEYKKADLTPEQFDEINKLWSVVKMNYQVCNGGIYQYFGNGYHKHWKSADGEVEIFDKAEQVAMLRKLHSLACEVLSENLAENSKLYRIIDFFDSLEYEENVPQHGMVECDEDEEIWDEDLQEYVPNPDYEEPYEDILDYEDEVRSTNSVFALCDFDKDYYDVNEHLEKVVELYAQYLDKSIEREKGVSVDSVIQDATQRSEESDGYTQEQLEVMLHSENPKDRLEAARHGFGLVDLLGDDNEVVRMAARRKLDELNGQPPRFPKVERDLD